MGFKFLIAKIIEKSRIPAIKKCNVKRNSKICSESRVYYSNVDRYTYIGSKCTVIKAEIGAFCSIADGCIIGGAQHQIEYVSTSPVFHKGHNCLKKNFAFHEECETPITKVGNDVWIGNNAIIKAGINIGDGSIIGMGSVVTKNVPAYEVWAGNPAHKIRDRFPERIVTWLQTVEWWNWEDDKIEEYSEFFNDPEKLIQIISGR